ncbi:MAG TPA: hypothetical protein VF121_07150 [Thermoanaerobaculia bacterium]|nr:hypothetical protein [Thermoanaerobaculia bacterium]
MLDVLRALPPARFARERREARKRLHAILHSSSPERWPERLAVDRAVPTPMFAWLVLSGSYELSFEDPAASEVLARLALAAAQRLPARLDAVAAHVEAQGWILVGHARTLCRAGEEAEKAFAEAERRQPAREPLEAALFCRFLAGLRRAQRRVAEALALTRRAIVLFQEAGCAGQEVAARNDQGILYLSLGERAAALREIARALLVAERWMSLDVALRCREGLARCALELHQLPLAWALLTDHQADETRVAPQVRAQLGLGRSTAALRIGQTEVAEAALRRVTREASRTELLLEERLAAALLAALRRQEGRRDKLEPLSLPAARRERKSDPRRLEVLRALEELRDDAHAGKITLAAAMVQAEALRRTALARGDEVLANLAWISALLDESARGRGTDSVRPGPGV